MRSEFKRAYLLSEDMKDELRKPLGDLYKNPDFEPIELRGKIVTVGDIITKKFLDSGVIPWICVIDKKSKREKVNFDIKINNHTTNVENPPGGITFQLWKAIENAYEKEHKTMIIVDGEEDLAALSAIFLAPENTKVIYGMPDEGVVVVDSSDSKEKVKKLLKKMEVK